MTKKDYVVFGDVLSAAEIGSWKIEVDEGKEPRMYADDTMRRLIGVAPDAKLTPEEVYHSWYDRVDPAHYDAVAEGVGYMMAGQMAEIQYPWHHPDGRVIVVRCGGVRDDSYTAGARVAGIHQWVTTMRHVDRELEESRRKLNDSLALVDGLSREYHTVWTIDGKTHELALFRTTGVTTAPGTVEYGKTRPNYDNGMAWYVNNFVDEADRDRVMKATSWESIVENTPDVGIYSVTYKRHPRPGETDYHQMCFAKAVNENGDVNYVFAYRDVDAIVRDKMREEEKHREEVENALAASENANRALDTANRHEQLRANALDYIFKSDDFDGFISYIARNILDLYGCDQVIYRDSDGRMILNEQPGTPPLDFSLCPNCPHYEFDAPVYADGKTVMSDCSVGYKGIPVHPKCHVKASLTQIVHRDGKAFGYLALHYLDKTHEFTSAEIESFDRLAKMVSLVLDRKADKRRLVEALDAAKRASRAKTEFLFNMSHDIRTPMNAIIGFTDIALKKIDDRPHLEDCLEKTKSAGELLLSIINNILDMSRVESGKARLEEMPGDVMLSFSRIESTMNELAEAHDVSLSFGFGEVRDRYVYADFDRCIRVFVNIISNAIKYSKANGHVKVLCEQVEAPDASAGRQTSSVKPQTPHKAWFRYTFADDGIGMSEEFQAHLFEEFARERNSTTSGIQGSGLGLALCKSLVELMDGTIECKSRQGEGTTFTVTLPFRVQEGKAYTDPATGRKIDVNAESVEPQTVSFKGMRVLLAEDNEMNREVAEYMLQERGLVVESAENGAVAVDMVREKGPGHYDFILMDIQMPVMNGYEATKSIRALEREWKGKSEKEKVKSQAHGSQPQPGASASHIPIIALSANAFAEDRDASLAAGMDAHLSKPIRAKALFEMIAKYV